MEGSVIISFIEKSSRQKILIRKRGRGVLVHRLPLRDQLIGNTSAKKH